MKKITNFFVNGRHFKEEFRRQLRLLIIITIGFTIAFSWRQTIFDAVQALVEKIFQTNDFSSTILTSTFITLFGLILIYITSQTLKEKAENY